MSKKIPFGMQSFCRGVDRLALLAVSRFNTNQCQRALLVDGLQKTVRVAIERRLRKLGGKA